LINGVVAVKDDVVVVKEPVDNAAVVKDVNVEVVSDVDVAAAGKLTAVQPASSEAISPNSKMPVNIFILFFFNI